MNQLTLNEEILNSILKLESMSGEPVLDTVVAQFKKDAVDKIQALRLACQAEELNEIRELSHFLKSSCAQLGADRLSSLFVEIESLSKSEDLPERIDTIEVEFENFQNALDIYLGMLRQ